MTNGYIQRLNELEDHKLEVMLVPLNPRGRNYNEGGMKRVVCNKPPCWYRDLCNRYPSSQGVRRGKFDTKIKRRNILALLKRLSRGLTTTSKYLPELQRLVQ